VLKDSRDTKETKELKETKEIKVTKVTADSKDTKAHKVTTDTKVHKVTSVTQVSTKVQWLRQTTTFCGLTPQQLHLHQTQQNYRDTQLVQPPLLKDKFLSSPVAFGLQQLCNN
jgi:Cu/Zn superoxide dismutase